jgi:RNA polymerase sigma factor (sigma-70 family)
VAIFFTGAIAPTVEDAGTVPSAPHSVDDRRRREQSEIAELVVAAAAGNKTAWDALVDKFAGTVWAIARGHRLSTADAADVSQTTWLRLVENLHRIQQPERVGAWLAVTARRESLRVLRLGARQAPTGYDFDVLPAPLPARPPEHAIATREWGAVVADLVQQLPTRSQVLLRLLSADSPLSYRDISEALNIPIGSIGPTRARALEQLRRLAIKAGIDPEDVFT